MRHGTTPLSLLGAVAIATAHTMWLAKENETQWPTKTITCVVGLGLDFF
jgi:hypothetical protein